MEFKRDCPDPGSSIGSSFDTFKIQNELVSNDEKMYSNIARSFLGYWIAQLLAINCYCKDEKDTYWLFKLLIERYEFLEHLFFEINELENSLLIKAKDFYNPLAFVIVNLQRKILFSAHHLPFLFYNLKFRDGFLP